MRYFVTVTVALLLCSCQPQAEPSGQSPSPQPSVAQTEAPPSLPRPAPQVTTKDQDGNPVDLSALYQKGIVLVYFYPKADTPGCTAQACSLRDSYEQLTEKGVTVVGVSLDDADSQKAFQKKYQLPFTLIPDTDQKMVKAFQVSHPAGFANREAFLIKDGEIVWHDASASTDKQASDVLKTMESW